MTYYPPTPHKTTELGIERFCRGCEEWWPEDEEFWYFQTKHKTPQVQGHCRACWSERGMKAGPQERQRRREAA
jgi:hypothetical protein